MQVSQPIGYNPHISKSAAPVFGSRSRKIKEADAICRLAMRECPVFSNTRLERANCSAVDSNILYKLYRYSDSLVGEIRGFSNQTKSPLEYYLRRLNSIRKFRAGNCSELADVTSVAFRLNGYKNADVYALHAYNPVTGTVRELDHTVVGVNMTRPIPPPVNSKKDFYGLDNGGIIVDPWAGITESERSASAMYKHDKSFNLKVKPEEIIVYSQCHNVDMREIFSDKDILYLKHKFPELVQKKKFSLWDRLVWRFMDKTKYDIEEIPTTLKETIKFNTGMKSALSRQELHELLNSPKR